ncbi:MAG TPA: hypothetical protein VMZ27_04450, partial [Candidatus Saccharimonadales bacterium]|nr:hypothetical protein [Candidatus Saccharimonadales bacterium]
PLPADMVAHPLAEQATGKPLNHPANLLPIYGFVAGMLQEPVDALAARLETNFVRLFGAVLPKG